MTVNLVNIRDEKQKDEKKDRLESLYGKIRIIDKQIETFKEKIKELKQKNLNDSIINALQRDVWNLEQDRKGFYDTVRGRSDKDIANENVIVMTITDVIEYMGFLAEQDLRGNKYKILRILRNVHCKGIDRYHDWLDELKESLLKRCMEVG